jgi:CHAT domain-containing protein
MDVQQFVQRLMSEETSERYIDQLHACSETELDAVVDALKTEADSHWNTDPQVSLARADQIVRIGQAVHNARHVALGTMARGDALKFLGRYQEAWDALDEAAALYRSVSDEIGWARTRIGRLFIGANLNRLDEVILGGQEARLIFERYGERERLLRLDLNTGYLYLHLGDNHLALEHFHAALATATQLGESGEQHTGLLLLNIGCVYDNLGNLHEALPYYERALAAFVAKDESKLAIAANANIANVALTQGRYRHALSLLHGVEWTHGEQFPLEHAGVRRMMVECYLFLNRFQEARELARDVIAECRAHDIRHELGYTLPDLAIAEAELGNFAAARAALDEAEKLFETIGAAAWVAYIRLHRGRVALRQGDLDTAMDSARSAADCFQQNAQQVSYAAAVLLEGEILCSRGDSEGAVAAARRALGIARRYDVLQTRYAAYTLLGRVSSEQRQAAKAARYYSAAMSVVERAQRDLTITLHAGFLENRQGAFQGLLQAYLRAGDFKCALKTLERAKSQALLNFLVNREHLRWLKHDQQSSALIETLERLRLDHHHLFQLAHSDAIPGKERVDREQQAQAQAQLALCERQMRDLVEQLYLYTGEQETTALRPPDLEALQAALDDDTLLIEFYNDGRCMWVFLIDRRTLQAVALRESAPQVERALNQLEFDVACALKAGADSSASRQLTAMTERRLQSLYRSLFEPFSEILKRYHRLTIVPFGALHFLPFHLLHDGTSYLLENHEVVVLPSAALLTAKAPPPRSGARVVTYDWEGRLPHAATEADMVLNLFGGNGDLYCGSGATRSFLTAAPAQVLHIAAHGQYRIDQPDLSYVELADGQLYTDDILQHDLSYELVTLSACETGRAKNAPGDELIGLGRGFLYAGAGALIVSLWRVDDALAVDIMEHFYRALRGGASKAAALRAAQQQMHDNDKRLHPAFWGAFQLVGNPTSLSTIS